VLNLVREIKSEIVQFGGFIVCHLWFSGFIRSLWARSKMTIHVLNRSGEYSGSGSDIQNGLLTLKVVEWLVCRQLTTSREPQATARVTV